MNMNKNLLLLSAAALPAICTGAAKTEKKPNILLIMTDQQNMDMINALRGLNSHFVSTPNLDRLVKSGYTFTNNYVAFPLSVPSRFAIFTGESPLRYGVRNNNPTPNLHDGIVPMLNQRAMGVIFKNAGYQTYYGGKVHLPFATGKGNALSGDAKGYGFDTFLTKDAREELGDLGAKFFAERKDDTPFLLVLSYINPHDICTEATDRIVSASKVKAEEGRNES